MKVLPFYISQFISQTACKMSQQIHFLAIWGACGCPRECRRLIIVSSEVFERLKLSSWKPWGGEMAVTFREPPLFSSPPAPRHVCCSEHAVPALSRPLSCAALTVGWSDARDEGKGRDTLRWLLQMETPAHNMELPLKLKSFPTS